LVRAKIKAQQGLLKSDSVAARRLREFERGVQSADRSNREAQAAKVYWANWLENSEISEPVRSDFRRIARGGGVNSLLDYGYAIIRAAVARMLVSAGLTPALGLFHTNRSNSFCLADDLMEPLRPLVDRSVRELLESGHREINRVTKRELLSILYTEITVDEIAGPLTVSCQRYVNSFVQCMLGKRNGLAIPTTCI
jgi:CRISPR-associated protein Cas1